jgi:polysaccharide biosynthesis protein PslH
MKILWVKSDFLHPTTKGGHVRTLEMLKRLHQRHVIHYAALDLAEQAGGVERSSEYCTKAYPIPHAAPGRYQPRFWLQAGLGLFSTLPLAVLRYRSEALKRQVAVLTRAEKFDSIVCDFLFAAPNIPDLSAAVLFQHNIESMIWKRHAENASGTLHQMYFRNQQERMQSYEGEVCRAVKSVIAVSQADAQAMRALYGVSRIAAVPTGVDVGYFNPPETRQRSSDLVFIGSMDWLPNIDGIRWFVTEILPLIHQRFPDCSLAIAGRRPPPEIRRLAETYAHIHVTGTVPDIRPYLWESGVSIVPLRIGGGTRLKIYEAMAAKIPVVSTTIGSEGLEVCDGQNIALADSPQDFADRCLALLADSGARRRMVQAAWEMVAACYSWEVVSRRFEQLLA